jgi:hypothetical protein
MPGSLLITAILFAAQRLAAVAALVPSSPFVATEFIVALVVGCLRFSLVAAALFAGCMQP